MTGMAVPLVGLAPTVRDKRAPPTGGGCGPLDTPRSVLGRPPAGACDPRPERLRRLAAVVHRDQLGDRRQVAAVDLRGDRGLVEQRLLAREYAESVLKVVCVDEDRAALLEDVEDVLEPLLDLGEGQRLAGVRQPVGVHALMVGALGDEMRAHGVLLSRLRTRAAARSYAFGCPRSVWPSPIARITTSRTSARGAPAPSRRSATSGLR